MIRNGVRIATSQDLNDKIVNVRRIGDRILSAERALEKESVHISNVYIPHVGKRTKRQF